MNSIRANGELTVLENSSFRTAGMGLLLASALTGCTTSLSVREDHATSEIAAPGIPYQLPQKEIGLEVTWTLKSCPEGPPAAAELDLEFETSAAVSSKISGGPTLLIDYTQMTNRFKSGSLIAEYYVGEDKLPTRILKSLNADIKGEEPAALKSGISAIAKIAKIAIGLPPSLPAGGIGGKAPPRKSVSACSDETRNNLAALKSHEDAIKAFVATSAKFSARIAVLQSRMVDGQLTPADTLENDSINKQIDALVASTEIHRDAAKTLRGQLSYSEKFEPVEDESQQSFKPNVKKIKKWLATLVSPSAIGQSSADRIDTQFNDIKHSMFEIMFKLDKIAAVRLPGYVEPTIAENEKQQDRLNREARAPRSWPGYLYRDPLDAKLVVTAVVGSAGTPEELVNQIERIPQFGALRLLPLRSRWGEHNTLVADFAPDGLPTKVDYKSPTANGVAAFESIDSAASGALEISGLIAARNATRKADQEGSAAKALAALKGEVETLEQRKKLLEFQNGPSQEIADINAELALLRLQKERAELQAAIRNAQKPADD